MTRDLLQLLWLRWRHLRGRASYWAALAGADLESTSLGERTYVSYVVILVVAWLVLMLSAAANGAATVGAEVGPRSATGFLAAMSVVPSILIASLGARALRSSPVKLTFPDIAYVGATALDTRAVALSSCLREVVPATVAAVCVGYLAGAFARGMGSPQSAPGAAATLAGLLVAAVFLPAWAVGLARVRTAVRSWPRSSWIMAPAAASVLLAVPADARWPGTALVRALEGAALPGDVLALTALVVLGIWLVALAAKRMDMTAVIEGSALYAQLAVFRPLQMYDPAGYSDIVRRKRLAARGPRFQLPGGSGTGALFARATLSHMRRPSTMRWPILWGAAILPYIAWLVVIPQGLFAYLPAVFVFVAGPARRLVYVFDQDADRPSLREVLPFGNLHLLAADTGPVLAIMFASSAIVWAILPVPILSRALGFVLSVSLGAVVVLCAGLERLRPPHMRAPIGYGITATIAVGATLLAATEGPGVACAVAMLLVVILAAVVRAARL